MINLENFCVFLKFNSKNIQYRALEFLKELMNCVNELPFEKLDLLFETGLEGLCLDLCHQIGDKQFDERVANMVFLILQFFNLKN